MLFCDTAGRLQTKSQFNVELSKMKRVIGKTLPNAPQETLLVIDATTGQNGMSQAEVFKESTEVRVLFYETRWYSKRWYRFSN
jgi:fused signal recognition particle receptor